MSTAQCAGCHQTFIRKTLRSLYDIPAYYGKSYLKFCDDCQKRLRQAYAYEGILQDEARKLLVQLNRAMDKHLAATLTLDQWIATLNRFNWRCAYCQEAPYEAIEHFIPIERGGGTTADNCVPACRSCNSAKGVRHPDDIRESSRSPAAVARVRAYLLTRRPPLPSPDLGSTLSAIEHE